MSGQNRNIGCIVFALTVLVYSTRVRADREGATFGVDDYGGTGECAGSQLSWATSQESAFWQETSLYTGGHVFDVIERNQNPAVDGRDFIDAALTGGADDNVPSGTDWADVVMFSGHGGLSGCTFTFLVMGDNDETCQPKLTSDIRLGNLDTGTLVMDASNCLQRCVWDAGNFDSLDAGNSGTQLAIANGYHGSPKDDQHGVQEMGDYAFYAKADGLGDDWVDIMQTIRSGADNDDCAVSIVFAANGTEADDAFYYGGLADQHSTETHSTSFYYYISGCDPEAGPAL